MKGVVDLFFRRKNVEMLLALRDKSTRWYITRLAKTADMTYPYALNVIKRLEAAGLVVTKKDGRTRYVELTEKGEEVAVALEHVYRQFSKL